MTDAIQDYEIAFIVPVKFGLRHPSDLGGAIISLVIGTQVEYDVASYFAAAGIEFNALPSTTWAEALSAFEDGRAHALAVSRSLASLDYLAAPELYQILHLDVTTDGDDHLVGGDGADILIGGLGDDTLDAGGTVAGQANFLLGGRGNDTYVVRHSTDIVDEGFIYPEHAGLPGDVDTIISHADFWWDFYGVGEQLVIADGTALPVTGIVGSLFDTRITGNSGNNIIFDLGGTNTIRPGDGVDFIALGAIDGYTGSDTIIIQPHSTGAASWAVIYDFEVGVDKIDLTAFGYGSFTEIAPRGYAFGDDAYFALGADGTDIVYFVGVGKAELAAGDFIF